MDEDERYQAAKERVKELRGFYEHLGIYIVVNITLFIINVVTAPGAWWFYWVTVFWGIGIIWHAYATFAGGRFMGKDWEERKIREILEEKK